MKSFRFAIISVTVHLLRNIGNFLANHVIDQLLVKTDFYEVSILGSILQ